VAILQTRYRWDREDEVLSQAKYKIRNNPGIAKPLHTRKRLWLWLGG
jgi:hypothetical protein